MLPFGVEFLYEEYRIGKIIKAEKIEKGYSTCNFVLKTGQEKYFFKQYRFDDLERMKEVHRAKEYFFNGGIPIIFPKRDRGGNTFVEYQGKYYALFPFINGRIIEEENFTAEALESLGKILAEIHILGQKKEIPRMRKEFNGWNEEKFFKNTEQILKGFLKKKEKNQTDVFVEEMVRKKIVIAEKTHCFYKDFGFKNDHLIHGDYYDANVFFDENDQVKYVFDFEKVQMAPRIFEVIRSVDRICFGGASVKQNLKRAKQYLQAYHKKYPLQKEEFEEGMVFYFFTRVYSVWAEEEYYLKGNTRVLPLLVRGKSRFQFWIDYREEAEVILGEIFK